MACSVVEVLAPNGKPSILYNSILNDVKDQSLALSKYLEIKSNVDNNKITQNDNIIWGHPTIGKSYLKERGDNSFITLDDDYANEVNSFVDAHRGDKTRQEYKGSKPEEYNKFMLSLFDKLKVQAKQEGKKLFVSNTNILKERMVEFDKVITLSKEEFKKRFDKRGATYGFEEWKSDIDETISKVSKSKVINTDGYLSDLLNNNIDSNGEPIYTNDNLGSNISLSIDDESNTEPTTKTNKQSVKEDNRFDPLIKLLEHRISLKQSSLLIAKKANNKLIVNKLNDEIEDLKNQIIEAESIKSISKLTEPLNRDKELLQSILSKKDISIDDIRLGQKIANAWVNTIDLYFNQEDKQSKELMDTFASLQEQMKQLSNSLDDEMKKSMVALVKEQLGKDMTFDEIIQLLGKDIGVFKADLQDISTTNSPLLVSLHKLRTEINFQAYKEIKETTEQVKKMTEKVLPLLKSIDKTDPFSIFKQLDSDGRATGDLISPYSQSFFKAKYGVLNKAKNSNSKVAWKEWTNWLKNNEISFDVRKIFPDADLYESNFTQSQIDEHIAELKKNIGENQYEKYYKLQEAALKEYKEEYNIIKEDIESSDRPDNEKAILLEDWVNQNSPYKYAEYVNTGNKYESNGKIKEPKGYDHIYSFPLRYKEDGSETGHYDKNFAKIEANKDLLEYYNFVVEQLYELKKYMSPEDLKHVYHNTLPSIQKSIMERYAQMGLKEAGIGLWDKLAKSMTDVKSSAYIHSYQDPLTKQIEENQRVGIFDTEQTRLNNLIQVKKIEFKQKTGKVPTKEQNYQFRQDAKAELAQERSFDLPMLLNVLADAAITHKYITETEGILRLAKYALTQGQEFRYTPDGEIEKDSNGKPLMKSKGESFENLKAMYDHYLNAQLGISEDPSGEINKKIYTEQEKEQKAHLEALLKTNEEQFEKAEISKEEYDKVKNSLESQINMLGSNVYWSKLGDNLLKYVQLKQMGWNVLSGVNNVLVGQLSNMLEASDGRSFTWNNYNQAFRIAMSTVGANVKDNTTAKKIRHLAEKIDLFKDSKYDVFKSTTHGLDGNKLGFINPNEFNKRGEYINQVIIMIATMLNKNNFVTDLKGNSRPLWEAFDKEGQWNTKEFGENEDWQAGDLTKKNGAKLNEFKYKIDRLVKRVHGNYDSVNSPTKFSRSFWKRALMQFRKWAIEGAANRFEESRFDEALGYETKGRYRTYKDMATKVGYIQATVNSIKSYLSLEAFRENGFQGLSEVDKANMKANMVELYMLTTVLAVTALISAGFKDDKDKRNVAINYLMNMLGRVQDDMLFYIYPTSAENILRKPAAVTQVLVDVIKFTDSTINFIEDKSGFAPGKDRIKAGTFKDWSKEGRNALSLIPFGAKIPSTISAGATLFTNKNN